MIVDEEIMVSTVGLVLVDLYRTEKGYKPGSASEEKSVRLMNEKDDSIIPVVL